jgi:hypothetical protein
MATKNKKSEDQYYTLVAEFIKGEFDGALVRIESPEFIKAGSQMTIRLGCGESVEVLIHSCVAE